MEKMNASALAANPSTLAAMQQLAVYHDLSAVSTDLHLVLLQDPPGCRLCRTLENTGRPGWFEEVANWSTNKSTMTRTMLAASPPKIRAGFNR